MGYGDALLCVSGPGFDEAYLALDQVEDLYSYRHGLICHLTREIIGGKFRVTRFVLIGLQDNALGAESQKVSINLCAEIYQHAQGMNVRGSAAGSFQESFERLLDRFPRFEARLVIEVGRALQPASGPLQVAPGEEE